MRHFQTAAFVVVFISLLFLFPASTMYTKADPLPPGLPPWFRELDTDHDGQVSLPEWVRGGKPRAEFRQYDLNGDGFITPSEVLRYLKNRAILQEKERAKAADSLPKGLPPWFKELDTDHDGQVSLREWVRGGRNRDDFRHYDLNGDGFITPDEVLRFVKKIPHLEFDGGQVDYQGTVEESPDERYQGKQSFKIFTIRLKEGKTYQIEQVSQIYFAYLYLEDPNGAIVDQHDSGGVGLTARIVHKAEETGTYRIIATSQGGFRTGAFELSVRVFRDFSHIFPEDRHTIPILPDALPLPKGLPSWFKELDTDEDGQVSLVEWLEGGRDREEFLYYDLNGDGFITPEEVMRFVKKEPRLRFEKGQINYSGTIEEEPEERYQGKKSFKIFTVKLEGGKTYQIEQSSQAFFSYLYLEDPSGHIVEVHDSGGLGLTARMIYKAAETGTYRIIATSQGGFRTGDFTLSIRMVRDSGHVQPKQLPPWFKELDTDEDGQVSLVEWLEAGGEREEFLFYDLNGDGFITPDEILRAMKKEPSLKFERGQINYQGKIEEEPEARYQGKKSFKIFTLKLEEGKTYQIEQVSQIYYSFLYLEDPSGEIVDQNNSGGRGLTARIVYKAAETGTYRIIATSQDGYRTGDFNLSIGVVRDPEGGPPQPLLQGVPPWFRELDTDRDGQVSLAEWIQGGKDRSEFRQYDLNGDGFITQSEVLRVMKNRAASQEKERGRP
jgi:Ca2+-binding EF-hand superfamily protein